MPHTGKLNALMCTAAPSRGNVHVLADESARLRQGLDRAVEIHRLLGSSRAPLLANANTVPMPPSMSIQESSLVAPVRYDSS